MKLHSDNHIICSSPAKVIDDVKLAISIKTRLKQFPERKEGQLVDLMDQMLMD